jgi:hypothetical protein
LVENFVNFTVVNVKNFKYGRANATRAWIPTKDAQCNANTKPN